MAKKVINVKGTKYRRAHKRLITIKPNSKSVTPNIKRLSENSRKEEGRSVHDDDEYDKLVEQGYVSPFQATLMRNKFKKD